MLFLYNSGLFIFQLGIRIAAFLGNEKASLWINGRRGWKQRLHSYQKKSGATYWIHCSSLGEFEQGRPLLETIRETYPSANIILSFFSPSGFEVRKNYPHADLVIYLPPDGRKNAKTFLDIIKPDMVLFIKYDYWYHYLSALRKENIPVYIVSGIFRKNQHFFKWYGGFFREMLRNISHFFLQDQYSGDLLKSIGIESFSISGDTRFDRVSYSARNKFAIPTLEQFKENSDLLVCGSTWPDDEKIILDVFNRLKDPKLKLLIAPHTIDKPRVLELKKLAEIKTDATSVQFFSTADKNRLHDCKILILDSIGQLSNAYGYATVAYIGGGFNKGIHNTLEAAAFGIPVLFGPKHEKFREASGLIKAGAAFCVHNEDEFALILSTISKQITLKKGAGKAAGDYVQINSGATDKIMSQLHNAKKP
ncbi:MAG: 3-deoxy-D-manno-octulosonic acid transferase [Bacteroidetes bacterium]|nr:MAG: 3-deoxy-D-manno-octulosonic acid transferase [Bacteroidota bacterium]